MQFKGLLAICKRVTGLFAQCRQIAFLGSENQRTAMERADKLPEQHFVSDCVFCWSMKNMHEERL